MKATAFLEARPAKLEVILAEPEQSFRWYEHDYPYALARWNLGMEYLLEAQDGRAALAQAEPRDHRKEIREKTPSD